MSGALRPGHLAWLALIVSGCGPDLPDAGPMDDGLIDLRGTVELVEPGPLPPGAIIRVTLADVSRADAPAVPIATTELGPEAGEPYAFSLAYDPGRVDTRFRYAVQTRIESDGKLLYINTRYIDAFASGGTGPVSVPVHRVGAAGGT